MEEFGRDMYKLEKLFLSKAKQVAKGKEKEAGLGLAGGGRRDTQDVISTLDYPPLKLASLMKENVKQFKVCYLYACMHVHVHVCMHACTYHACAYDS